MSLTSSIIHLRGVVGGRVLGRSVRALVRQSGVYGSVANAGGCGLVSARAYASSPLLCRSKGSHSRWKQNEPGPGRTYPKTSDLSPEELRTYDSKAHVINEEIPDEEVRLIIDKEELGIMPRDEAIKICQEKGLDLVAVNDKIKPPVCKGMDYEKHLRKLKQDGQEQPKNQKPVVKTKEVRFTPVTQQNEMSKATRMASVFLVKGYNVKMSILFKAGTRHLYKEGIQKLDEAVEQLQEVGTPKDLKYRKIAKDESGKPIFQPLQVLLEPSP